MAKKKENPTDMSVEIKLKSLYQLQTMLSEIDKIRILRGELPLEVEDLEDEIEGLKTRIENSNEEIKNSVRASMNSRQKLNSQTKNSTAISHSLTMYEITANTTS